MKKYLDKKGLNVEETSEVKHIRKLQKGKNGYMNCVQRQGKRIQGQRGGTLADPTQVLDRWRWVTFPKFSMCTNNLSQGVII